MSYFCDGVVYVIVPTADITNAMINASKLGFNTHTETLRKSIDGTLTLFKIKMDDIEPFKTYECCNCMDIKAALDTADWEDPTV
jgi:hypothetical protein